MPSSVHRRTPSLTVQDSRGLAVRQVAYWRTVADGVAQALVTRQSHDALGRLTGQSDPRWFDVGSRPNLVTAYTLGGEPVRVESVDAGRRLSLPGPTNETLQRWDLRGTHWRYRHDRLLRVISVDENRQEGVEQFTYADGGADAEGNLRGRLTGQFDPAGTVAFHHYGLHGQALSETRTFAGEPETYTTSRRFGPLGNMLGHTDAGGHRQESRYDLAGQLAQGLLQLAGAGEAEPVLLRTSYDAAGQPTERLAGNGVLSTWSYDPTNNRLIRQLARKGQERPLQDLHYFHDPMGNVLRIEDHTLATVYFANQRVEPHRHFVYDSLYRLIETRGFEGEIPQQSPGLPQPVQPIDPGRRFSYTEHYRYDTGNNLVELLHVREGHNFTWQTVIDAHSNRGVRQKAGDPDPVFTEHFDAHGNQLKLQPGTLPLEWNSRDQLARVTLVRHSNGLPDDEESYRYSQGVRVHKRWLSHTPSVTHRREVHYLPGLQIHTRSDGQRLHVIELPGARCLHWLSGKPADIEADQLRYSLDDHLGSCSLELDRRAGVISLEHYYAFGGTAWWGARSLLEASHKTVRYSGQEMDASGLYHYGARYYAPWLQRWVSADPAGDVDGLNLYAFVGNDPVNFIDVGGEIKEPALAWLHRLERESDARRELRLAPLKAKKALSEGIERHMQILALSLRRGLDAQQQILSHRTPTGFAASVARRGATHLAGQAVAYAGGLAVGVGSQALGAVAPGAGNVVGVAMGFAAKKAITLLWDYAAERTGASASIKFKASRLSPEKIIQKAEYKTMAPFDYARQKYSKMLPDTQKGALKAAKEGTGLAIGLGAKQVVPGAASEVSAVAGTLLGAVEIVHEAIGAVGALSPEKTAKGDAHLTSLIEAIDLNMLSVENLFDNADVNAIHTFSYFGDNAGDTKESLRLATRQVVEELKYTQTMLRSHSHRFSAV
ncbi:RHS repeat-associated core domain-containing protein [Pseudomonas sp. NPDC089534]|uniref:RHS repeat-associated core domain-containing protein n=1 Tax=Pseudomonas sp. NPDC089534 TaxID=3364468 RepID=UPI00381BFAA7